MSKACDVGEEHDDAHVVFSRVGEDEVQRVDVPRERISAMIINRLERAKREQDDALSEGHECSRMCDRSSCRVEQEACSDVIRANVGRHHQRA